MNLSKNEPERISKIMSTCGHCSRREAERLIFEGRISVNGQTIYEPGTKILPGVDILSKDGKELKTNFENNRRRYFLLNKPCGYLTTCKDEFSRQTIFDIIKLDGHYFPVGRLDLDSRGLVLITNDGIMCDLIIHPRNRIKKIYIVKASRMLSREELEKLKQGVKFEEDTYRADDIVAYNGEEYKEIYEEPSFGEFVYKIVLTEGKKREIRRMMKAIKARVIDLFRVSIGPLSIAGIAEGKYRELNETEIDLLKKHVNYEKYSGNIFK